MSASLMIAVACGRAPQQVDLHPIPNQNVLLITVDTLRADALGSYGGRAATPVLDRLAREGVRFDFAHAHAVVTLTSHASILTGQYPFQHGLRDNSGYRLPATAQTIATRLKAGGYATAAFVGAFPLHSRFGLNVGFDVYDDRFGEAKAPTDFVMPERPAGVVVSLARAWLQHPTPITQHPSPITGSWFTWIHLFDPHAPYVPSYQGEVEKVDAALAPLLDDLRAAARPTLVIVTADHGESLGEHGEQSHGLFAYEATLRVPLIVATLGGPQEAGRGSSSAQAGEVSLTPARHIDLMPTILDAVGQPIPPDLPGRSLLTATERRATADRPSYFEAMSGMLNRGTAPLAGVLVDHEKYIELPLPERYDLKTDGGERINLAGRAPERDRTLAGVLRGYNAAAPGARVTESPEAVERLRALGYAAGNASRKANYTEADDPKQFVEIDAAMHQAVEAFAARRPDEAIQIYQRILAKRPDFALAYRHLGFLEWQRGNLAGAIELLQRAVKAGVADRAIVAQLGGYLVDAGRVAQGIQLLEPVVADAAADPDTLNTLGIAYARAGRAADARRAFERVLAINPRSSVPLENLGMLALEHGDTARARDAFARAADIDPQSSRAHSGLGVAALRAGDRRAAIDAFTRALAIDPRNFEALYNLGTTLAHDGQFERAKPYLEQFIQTAPPAYARDKQEIERLLRHP